MYNFCTYFDRHYLSRALALYQSLESHCNSFQLWALCMDRDCYDVLSRMNLPRVQLITLEEFEDGDEKLQKAGRNRSRIEYYFTCTPSLPLFVLNNFSEVDLITYLDSDVYFFADPKPLYDEIADNSIAIIGHRFPPALRDLERFGIYNVSWVSFRRDEHGLECLHWWRDRCIEWCYDREDDGRFADQKYLDNWPCLFKGVIVLSHKGANLAPWNLTNYKINSNEGNVWVDEQPLIFFHFHGFQQINNWLYDPNVTIYKMKTTKIIRQHICAPYITTLAEMDGKALSFQGEGILHEGIRQQTDGPGQTERASLLRRGARLLKGRLNLFAGIFAGRYILTVKGRVI